MKPVGTLSLVSNTWVVEATPDVILRLKRIFPSCNQETVGKVAVRATPEHSHELLWVMKRFPLVCPDEKKLKRFARSFVQHVERMQSISDVPISSDGLKMAIPARPYQTVGARYLLEQHNLLLGDEFGVGKTVTAITTFTDPRTIPACVVVQAHLPTQWAEEVVRFLPQSRVHVIKKMEPYDLPPADVYIITYRKLANWVNHLAPRVRSVVFDEAQELRRRDSDQYNASKLLAAACDFKMGLSATPIYNYGNECWNIFNVLAPGALGKEEEFLREWCIHSGNNYLVRDTDALGHYLRSSFLMLRRTRKELGRELPPVIRCVQEVGFNKDAYANATSSAEVLARTMLTSKKFTERGQATREFDMRIRLATGLAKAPYMCDFVRMLVESGEKVVFSVWHHAVYEIIRERLRDLKPVFFTGGETPSQKEQAKKDFIEGRSPIFVINNRSGTGLNGLQMVCTTVVIGELDWAPAVIDQTIARLARDGQDFPVNAYILVADAGSDPVLAEVLGTKRAQASGIIELGEKSDSAFMQIDPDRIKKVARQFLRSKGINVDEGQQPELSLAGQESDGELVVAIGDPSAPQGEPAVGEVVPFAQAEAPSISPVTSGPRWAR